MPAGPLPAATTQSVEAVPYFAYGANMASTTLAKRGVQPLSSQPAVMAERGTWLSFSHRGGYATLQRQRRRQPWDPSLAPVLQPAWLQPHGALLMLRPGDLQRLTRNEIGYQTVQLAVQPYAAGSAPCRAAAFVSSPLLQLYRPVTPTQRYRDLLLEGCRQHGLDAGYVAWLEGLEVATADSPGADRDKCPAESLARALAAAAVGGAAWASVHL